MEEAFDPNSNADYAARLLLRLYHGEAAGSWDLAVGLYHSHTLLLATEFRHRVALLLDTHVLRAPFKGDPHYMRVAHNGSLRPTPGNGRLVSTTLYRQP